ncbi:B-cell receptor CD22-like [Clupea harengus]|uniref:B-cell receptor CD22-like n=1 Tax=Clupea harengus TaxID=7950 RepID=A0A8M1KL02_CLUHA|nr:B-cell receptor CD22-like [Clupea harengus]
MTDYEICAVTGSSVVMPCSFTHPHGLTVTTVYWVINAKKDNKLSDLSKNPEYKDRVQYSTDIKDNCTLTLSDVRVTDTASYYARIEAKQKWMSAKVTLTVTGVPDLVVQISGAAIEGKKVKLSCISHCTLKKNSKTMWKSNGKIVPDVQTDNNLLILHNIKIEDEGIYSCALEDQEDHPSPPMKLNVMYPPKKTSVSVSPDGEILEGASVTLTCSSVANPPVDSYTWFKTHGQATSVVGSEQTYNIPMITSGHSGNYSCLGKNQHGGRNSTDVPLDVQYASKNTAASVSPSGDIVEGSSVTLTCISDANPPVQSYTWYRKNESAMSTIATQQVYSISKSSSEHAGLYYCQAKSVHGATNSTVIRLDVLYPPKGTSVSLNHTGHLVEGSSVTLTCSSDANPPVENYTWYVKTRDTTARLGSGKSITFNLTSTNVGLYHCEANSTIASQNSASVEVSLAAGPRWQSVPSIAGGAVALLAVLIVAWLS